MNCTVSTSQLEEKTALSAPFSSFCFVHHPFCSVSLLFPSSQFPIGFQSRLKNKIVMLLSKFKLGTIDILKIKLSKSEREKWVKILCSWFPSEMLKSTFAVKVQTWLASHLREISVQIKERKILYFSQSERGTF